jgi:tetratricopeptide (TPR) repeat protein
VPGYPASGKGNREELQMMLKVVRFFFIVNLSFQGLLFSQNPAQQEVLAIYQEAKTLFLRANDKAGDESQKALEYYKKAAYYFESLYLNHGIKNGKLFYNIGNAYFRANNIGKAILYYKNAQLYIPNDENLKKNLDFVRSKRIDNIKEEEKRQILKTIFFWHFNIATNQKLNIFIVSFILLWLWASLLLVFKKKFLRRFLIITIGLSTVFLVSYSVDLLSHIFNREGVILDSSIVARKGDGITYQPSFNEPLHEGTEFNLIEKRRDWYNIELVDGKRCWIPQKSAALVLDN